MIGDRRPASAAAPRCWPCPETPVQVVAAVSAMVASWLLPPGRPPATDRLVLAH
jgi:hypothetical protein